MKSQSSTLKGLLSGPNPAPAVSVVIPAYNSAAFIAESLDSVFFQIFQDFEVIVVNDGSPDTPELERVLQRFQERIVYIRQEGGGVSAARNTGIRAARGEYLAFLDSDDCWPPEYLAAQMKCLQQDPGLDLIYADATLFGNGPLPRERFMQISPATDLDGLLSDGGQILPSGTVVKKRAMVAAGLFDESLRRCEDIDMWLRLAAQGAILRFQPEVLFRRRVHGSELTSDEEKMVSSLLRVLMKVDGTKLSPRGRGVLKRQLLQAQGELGLRRGKTYLAEGNATAAKEALRAAYAFFRTPKLAFTLLGLHVAPRITMWGARTLMSGRGGRSSHQG